ncbi:hypothetical protein [Sphaerotilus microaerophilus]|jgi:hypothetical protein|uniref:Plasmid maintenance system killer n=1 Tax=Sphaerotilus microaerophilus TaxID=2914710 RepID=A0ABN6PKH7_9BURK|nr:hypothetical protein [Sphaerotilus sp. FB-5]BDI04522.1 hypothetical protein CATMQ487_14920 [Sphaerotilus sp. FB-5]
MAGERVVRGIVATSAAFVRALKGVKDAQLQREIQASIRSLLFLDLDQSPSKLHLHQLKNHSVPSSTRPGVHVNPWTIHVTSNDSYKASFTLEDGIAYLRNVDEHDRVDKFP